MSWLVITAEEKLPPFPVLTHALASARKLDPDTAAKEARHCWGVLGTDLDDAAAAALGSACADFGVRLIKLPAAGLPALPPPFPVKKVVFGNGAAVFTAAGGELSFAPHSLAVLAAAPIKQVFSRTIKTTEGPSSQEKVVRLGIMAATGLPIGLGSSKETKKEVKNTEMSFYLDIIPAGGRSRLRLISDDLDFSGLKEKKTYSSQVNFTVLCRELAAFAPKAWKNAGLSSLLAGSPLAALPYDSLTDLETETLRLALARGR